MIIAEIIFLSQEDLLDFELKVLPQILDVNSGSMTILGFFTDAEIELAINGYHARIAA